MTPKTRIHLIRHGEVEGAGPVRRYNGHTDVGLSERGRSQYHAIKERFTGVPITAIYSSDLTRCVWGAEVLGAHLGLTPECKPELREMGVGIWEGKSWPELMEQYPDQWRTRLDDIVNYRVPGGENVLDVHRRVMPVINDIVERHRGEDVLVVAHGGVNRIILLNAIGAPLSSLFAIEQTYCCLNVIDYFSDGNTVVKLVNG